jgi:hypothetical protein
VPTEEAKVDSMLDLRDVLPGERWRRIDSAIRLLEDRGEDWRLKLLLDDTPEGAALVRRLLARGRLRYDTSREPGGGQSVVVGPGPMARAPLTA